MLIFHFFAFSHELFQLYNKRTLGEISKVPQTKPPPVSNRNVIKKYSFFFSVEKY